MYADPVSTGIAITKINSLLSAKTKFKCIPIYKNDMHFVIVCLHLFQINNFIQLEQ